MSALTSMLLLATATGPGLVAVGVASRLFDGAPAIHDPLLVDMVGFGEAVEGPMVIDEEGCIWPMWRESETGEVPHVGLMRPAQRRQCSWRRRDNLPQSARTAPRRTKESGDI
jgi:hypothetical protein